jgi:phosphoribosyl 1,2-cyclic phosphate phosphodiesterase
MSQPCAAGPSGDIGVDWLDTVMFHVAATVVKADRHGIVSIMAATARSFTFLGTGTSTGVPMLGCQCRVCTSDDPRNQRYRCSVLIRTPAGNLLIDTPPELRLQLLRTHTPAVHAVVFTHFHADHLFGLDDIRPMPHWIGGPVPLYCTADVEEVIRKAFAYAFLDPDDPRAYGYRPQMTFHRIAEEPFEVLDQTLVPIPLLHATLNVLGFRIGNTAYCTDVSEIPERSWPLLEGLDVLVLDALRFRPHPAHFTIDEALEVIARVRPKQAYLTHMSHDIDHETVTHKLPTGVELAYDGLSFEF